MTLPTYSLLKKHGDVVQYRIPHPSENTSAWVEIGLFPWKLEGEKPVPSADPTSNSFDTVIERAEGVGLRVRYYTPQFHSRPPGIRHIVTDLFDTFSNGMDNGHIFRIQNATASEFRQTGKFLALYAFAYWWWIEQHSDYPLKMEGTREEMEMPTIESVLEDGTVIDSDGNSFESPYSIAHIELLAPEEWESPYERAKREIEEAVDGLDHVQPHTIRQALRNVEDTITSPTLEKTEAKKDRERLKSVLRDIDGVGRRLCQRLLREFDSVEELCSDIETGKPRLSSLNNIGDTRQDEIVEAVQTTEEWDELCPQTDLGAIIATDVT